MHSEQSAIKDIRGAGLSATRQRIKVLSILRKNPSPHTVEALIRVGKGAFHMTTIYRVLRELTAAGLVRRLEFQENHAFYEAEGVHHHHALCRECGMIEDVSVCVPPHIVAKAKKAAKGFHHLDEHTLEFFGVCRKCA